VLTPELCACVKGGSLATHQRYAHAKQFKRAKKALRKLRTFPGRTVRDIERQLVDNELFRQACAWPLYQARTVLEQRPRQKGEKIYSLHAPGVECIGKGKAHKLYEFGVKVSIATTLNRSRGGSVRIARLRPAWKSLRWTHSSNHHS